MTVLSTVPAQTKRSFRPISFRFLPWPLPWRSSRWRFDWLTWGAVITELAIEYMEKWKAIRFGHAHQFAQQIAEKAIAEMTDGKVSYIELLDAEDGALDRRPQEPAQP